jgi:hypothetical protein
MTDCEVGNGLFALVTTHKPSRRLANVPDSEKEDASGDELDGEWDKPLLVGRWQCLANAIINPETTMSGWKGRTVKRIYQKPTSPPLCQPISYIPIKRPRIAGGEICEHKTAQATCNFAEQKLLASEM